MWEAIKQFFEKVGDWLAEGVWEWASEVIAVWVEWYAVALIKAKILMIEFSWDVAKNIMINIGLSDLIVSSWDGIPPEAMMYLAFFQVPEAINMVLQALVTRFVMKVVF